MSHVSLENLHQQIAQRERELEALRRELESRQNQVTALMRRKEELQDQLRQVESEIATLTAVPPPPTEHPKKTTPPAIPTEGRARLSDLILTVLREAGKAMTARQVSEIVQRRGFPLTGRNPAKSVEARLQEMKQKGIVRRASGQPGYLLASSADEPKDEKPKLTPPPHPEERKAAAKPVKPAPAAKTAQPGQKGKQPPLREVLTNVLKHSRKPLSGSELAERVVAAGYKTKNTKFVDAVWSILRQMDNVEHIKGKGYQLKRK